MPEYSDSCQCLDERTQNGGLPKQIPEFLSASSRFLGLWFGVSLASDDADV